MNLLKSFIVAVLLGAPLGYIVTIISGHGGYEDFSLVFIIPAVMLVTWVILLFVFRSNSVSKNFATNIVIGIIFFFIVSILIIVVFGIESITRFIQCLKYC